MAGIYIHIPFCRKACHYCNFHFSTTLRDKNDLLAALLAEIKQRRDYLGNTTIDTIYFGGGTPSILEPEELFEILDVIEKLFSISPGAERTLEANPDDVSAATAEAWRQLGFNRISLGVQSFNDEELRWMNRSHNAEEAATAIRYLQAAGIGNLTADLIYGSPLLDDAQWEANLNQMLSYGIPHLSCYALTVEPKTALARHIEVGRKADIDPDRQARQFELLIRRLSNAGFEHYEISNFAKPGFRSRHNSAYWQGMSYIGLGPAAHSFNGHERRWNVANNAEYIRAITAGDAYWEEEQLTIANRLNEYLMTSLRLQEGINLERIGFDWGEDQAADIRKRAERFISEELLEEVAGHLRLTMAGKFLADGIAAELFV